MAVKHSAGDACVQRWRSGATTDIADVVVFLATDAARFVVGQLIHVNGGDYHG
jgi:NAD(P)-dependent dehydrogenase (short-subunit alcohol dehydrogenase family)